LSYNGHKKYSSSLFYGFRLKPLYKIWGGTSFIMP